MLWKKDKTVYEILFPLSIESTILRDFREIYEGRKRVTITAERWNMQFRLCP